MSPARRAVLRWAARLFRREWRQQAVVLALLTVAVAVAILGSAAVYNTSGVSDDATFGTANHRYVLEAPSEETVAAAVEAARARFGPVDVVAEWSAPIPGSVASLAYRAQDPDGPASAPMLAPVRGRYPTAAGEVAVTDGTLSTLQVELGGTLDLDGVERRIVGLVENPSDLDAEFALVPPGDTARAETVTLLLGGQGAFDEVRAIRAFGTDELPGAELTSRGDVDRAGLATAVLGVAELLLALIGLVAAAGFVALAQRRLRQLGLLSAVGATERHLRLVVLANGALVGATAATAGAVLGLASWVVAAPRLEAAAGYRIDVANVPWWLVVGAMAAALATATGAAWIPARAIARVPITSALAGRPPPPSRAGRSAVRSLAVLALGVAALVVAGGSNPVVLGIGTLGVIGGVLGLGPLAIQSLGRVAGPLPVGTRLALRDLARYRARSGAALAAVSAALGIPVAVVVIAGAADARADLGNLPPEALIVWTRDPSAAEGVSPFFTEDSSDEGFAPYLPDLSAGALADRERAVDGYTDEHPATVTPLRVAVDPRVADDPDGQRAITLARQTDIGFLDVALLYVADEDVIRSHGLESSDLDADLITTAPAGPPEIVTDASSLWVANTAGPPAPVDEHQRIDRTYSSLPGSFITPEEIERRGWDTATVGWLVRGETELTPDTVADLRAIASDNDLLVEARVERRSLLTLRWGATAAGALVALAVLAMTVGIVRAEAAPDLRTLTAAGATRGIRRTLTSSTAGGLAALGALLGTTGAYVALAAGYVHDTRTLRHVPVAELLTILVGVPLLAVVAGRLVAGREPTGLARDPD